MKTIALIALWPLFFGYTSNEPEPAIMGDWLLQESYMDGCFTTGKTYFKPTEQRVLHFSPPNRYTTTVSDTLVTFGTFKITPGKNIRTGKEELILILNTEQSISSNPLFSPPESTIYELTSSRLAMSYSLGTFSGGSVYTRVQ